MRSAAAAPVNKMNEAGCSFQDRDRSQGRDRTKHKDMDEPLPNE